MSLKRAFPWWGIIGVLIFGLGVRVLAQDIEVWNVIWYIPAWYGYLLLLDAAIYRLQGHSFLSHRRQEAGAMLFWSAPFWYIYEGYNLVLKNWYYVFILRSDWAQGLLGFAAFATVLPACFVHAELLKALGWWENLRWSPFQVTSRVMAFAWGSGLVCLVLPVVLPGYAFFLVWGATLGIPEAVNYRTGAPSLLRDLETGRPGRLFRLLAGGAWAGLVWEGFNYWARCKWIYTVPGLEDWKVFEMPLLGFLGFPVLALNAFACYATLCHFIRGGRHWEAVADAPVDPLVPRRYALVVVVALLFSLLSGAASLRFSVQSRRPVLAALDGLDEQATGALRDAGIPTPERLYRTVGDRGSSALAGDTGTDPGRLDRAYRHAALALHKGMGTDMARLLQRVGIRQVSDLAAADPRALHHRLSSVARGEGRPIPRQAEVKVWVRAARIYGRTRR